MPDTIFALATGRLPSAVAVIRLSGPLARFALETLSGSVPEPRRMRYGALRTGDGIGLDRGMTVYFPGPASATGEDCAELHLHGGRSVVEAASRFLLSLGLRPAEPGEFTRRAFLNGRLDLAQAEAVADLIAADTEAQRRFAEKNLAGRQGELYAAWRQRLLRARAMAEAELDFADEGDVTGSAAETVWPDVASLQDEIARHADGFARAALLHDGFEVVILGAPNAGKSSLLNALARRDVAIVSDEAGTTRDLLEVELDLLGLKVRLVDTAGLRADAPGRVERLGIERARDRAAKANLVLHLVDLSQKGPSGIVLPAHVASVTVGSKSDLAGGEAQGCDLAVSSHTGAGLDALLALLAARAEAATGGLGDVLPSRERHVAHLHAAARRLEAALDFAAPLELRAEELRLAAAELGRVTGEIGTEEVLGAIFSTFCIGK